MKKYNICCNFFVKTIENNDGRVDDGNFHYSPHYIGNGILLYGRRSSHFPKQAFVGSDWHCMAFTYLLIIVPSIFFLLNVAPVVGPPIIAIGVAMSIITLT